MPLGGTRTFTISNLGGSDSGRQWDFGQTCSQGQVWPWPVGGGAHAFLPCLVPHLAHCPALPACPTLHTLHPLATLYYYPALPPPPCPTLTCLVYLTLPCTWHFWHAHAHACPLPYPTYHIHIYMPHPLHMPPCLAALRKTHTLPLPAFIFLYLAFTHLHTALQCALTFIHILVSHISPSHPFSPPTPLFPLPSPFSLLINT